MGEAARRKLLRIYIYICCGFFVLDFLSFFFVEKITNLLHGALLPSLIFFSSLFA